VPGGGGSPQASVQIREAAQEARAGDARKLTLPQLVSVLRVAGWPESEIPEAVDVAGCESGWALDAIGTSGERGLFQIHPMHDYRFEVAGVKLDPTDPVHNASAALAIWELYGWEPWTCQSGG
ncbi:MAG: transglycosylase SLT domain-containing protein, partial [Dehalococcoidia bacterium]